MLWNRVFNLVIGIALVLVVALTVREAFATTAVTSQPNSEAVCAALPQHLSIHTQYRSKARMFVPYSNNGPTGVDGGLLEMLAAYPNCSR